MLLQSPFAPSNPNKYSEDRYVYKIKIDYTTIVSCSDPEIQLKSKSVAKILIENDGGLLNGLFILFYSIVVSKVVILDDFHVNRTLKYLQKKNW